MAGFSHGSAAHAAETASCGAARAGAELKGASWGKEREDRGQSHFDSSRKAKETTVKTPGASKVRAELLPVEELSRVQQESGWAQVRG